MKIAQVNSLHARKTALIFAILSCSCALVGCGGKATDTVAPDANSPANAQAAAAAGEAATAAQQADAGNRAVAEANSKAAFDEKVRQGGAQ